MQFNYVQTSAGYLSAGLRFRLNDCLNGARYNHGQDRPSSEHCNIIHAKLCVIDVEVVSRAWEVHFINGNEHY